MTPPASRAPAPPRPRRRQRGLSLLFALVALVILALGAAALTRTVDTGTLVMGNLSFRQDAMLASSAAAEQAMAWLEARKDTPDLNFTSVENGYYSSSIDTLDATGNRTRPARRLPLVDWLGDHCAGAAPGSYEDCGVRPFTGEPVNGNRVQWVIMRLCERPNEPPAGSNACIRPAHTVAGTWTEMGELSPSKIEGGTASPYYRIIVRVQGPRNTVSHTESLVHF